MILFLRPRSGSGLTADLALPLTTGRKCSHAIEFRRSSQRTSSKSGSSKYTRYKVMVVNR
jgi:hypothetical protein